MVRLRLAVFLGGVIAGCAAYWQAQTEGTSGPIAWYIRHYPQYWGFEIHSKILYRNVVLKLCRPQAISIT